MSLLERQTKTRACSWPAPVRAGNVESMLVQICSFLAMSGARVEAACAGEAGGGATKAQATQESARRAYLSLKEFHDKRGWAAGGR